MIMAKSLVEVIDDYFLKELRQARSNPKAYEAATEKFEQDHGFEVPYTYDNFRMKKSRKNKKR